MFFKAKGPYTYRAGAVPLRGTAEPAPATPAWARPQPAGGTKRRSPGIMRVRWEQEMLASRSRTAMYSLLWE